MWQQNLLVFVTTSPALPVIHFQWLSTLFTVDRIRMFSGIFNAFLSCAWFLEINTYFKTRPSYWYTWLKSDQIKWVLQLLFACPPSTLKGEIKLQYTSHKEYKATLPDGMFFFKSTQGGSCFASQLRESGMSSSTCKCLALAPALNSSFQLTQTPRGSSNGSSEWIPATHK